MLPQRSLHYCKSSSNSSNCDPPDLVCLAKGPIENAFDGMSTSFNNHKSRTFIIGSRKFPRYRSILALFSALDAKEVALLERVLDMELETPYHSDIDGYGCNEDSIFSYMFGTLAFPNEKRKEIHSNYALAKTDKKIFHGSERFNPVFPGDLEVSYRSAQFPNDLIVISSAVKDLNCESLKKLNLDGSRREMIHTDKEKVGEMMTSDAHGSEDLFLWSNGYKIEANNFKKDEERNEYIGTAPVVRVDDSSNSSGGKKRLSGDKNRELESSTRKKKKTRAENGKDYYETKEGGGCRMPPWHVDEIQDMAADLDGSLSALSTDLTAASYNMSEALLSLPSLTVFKQEAPSPSQESVLHHQNLQQSIDEPHDQNTALQRLLQQQNFHGQIKRGSSGQSKNSEMSEKNDNCRFQYVLAAATSIATKLTEETLTYLNQGQSYEIKLKKVGELSNFRGKILKSVIRICFHERRLQYMEKEQILAWQASRPGERIVELDVPLSYGLFDVEQDPHMLNMLSFLWDPTKEVGAYIKVNCISTEFTPKKHGGEKGVPFRIQVETFIEGESTRLHAAACQIKVFKLKGADRKHKQDREKILKRPPSEQDKYQPSYECTVLSDLSPDAVFPALTSLNSSAPAAPISKPNTIYPTLDGNDSNLQGHSPLRAPVSASVVSSSNKIENSVALCDILVERSRSPAPVLIECSKSQVSQLTPESNTQQTAQWLRKNSFGNYITTFSNFSGADILRLTRDDLIQICGLADGIRLLYALHSKAIVRLTVYFCTPGSTVFHAVYLDQIGRNEISRKLATLLGILHSQIRDIYMQGPNGIRVLITDEVVGNIKDESMFSIEVLKDESCDRFMLLLKPASGGT